MELPSVQGAHVYFKHGHFHFSMCLSADLGPYCEALIMPEVFQLRGGQAGRTTDTEHCCCFTACCPLADVSFKEPHLWRLDALRQNYTFKRCSTVFLHFTFTLH